MHSRAQRLDCRSRSTTRRAFPAASLIRVHDVSQPPIRFPLSQRLRSARQSLAGQDVGLPARSEPIDPFAEGKLVGAAIEARRKDLVSCGEELNRLLVDERTNAFVTEQLQRLGEQVCRVAIIGQVKAGKSSFINAFVGMPDLLPTDVNPWTTAVTSLHFERRDAPAGVAAEFTFFDRDEWARLVNGGGQIRELTKRLVPGFEVELLNAHVELMQRRSQQRLGDTLQELLGTRHAFPDISREVIERYVCSGLVGTVDLAAQGKGIFSDVTKHADLYFAESRFGCATTIIDTPGTNDPFLIRDEITRRTLDSADIYIVVLTARQPLSTADIALLRILRGLHKERIIVFINRIDELANPVEEGSLIVQHVRRGLQRDFPGVEFPIVAGSALWGNSAFRESSLDSAGVVTPQLKSYAAHAFRDRPVGLALSPQSPIRDIKDALLVCSGLPQLASILADAVWRHASHGTRQIAASFTELSRIAEISIQHEINQLKTPVALETTPSAQRDEELRQIKAALADYQRLTVTLHGLVVDMETRSDQLIRDETDRISEELRGAVLDFIEAECQRLGQAMLDGLRVKTWRAQTGTVRQKLESILVSTYREAQQKLATCEATLLPELRGLLLRMKPDFVLPPDVPDVGVDAALPSLSALGNLVALDLEEPWWRIWWTGRRSSSERLLELDRLARLEFFPIVETLSQSVRSQLRVQQQALLRRSTVIYVSMAEMLEAQGRAKIERSKELIGDREAPPLGAGERKPDERLAELADYLVRAQDVGRKLGAHQEVAPPRAEAR